MGILNHLQLFLPNLQVHSDQLRPSLKASNKNKVVWGEEQQSAFSNILQLIANITKMFHYDQNRKTRVKCDASRCGLGAALEQEVESDVWVAIALASRFLNDQEKNIYSTNELNFSQLSGHVSIFVIFFWTTVSSFLQIIKRLSRHSRLIG